MTLRTHDAKGAQSSGTRAVQGLRPLSLSLVNPV